MKRFSRICCIIAGIVLLSGCANNPEKDVVANKSNGLFEQELSRNNEEPILAEAPASYQDEFTTQVGNVKVTVDAEVSPLESPISVACVTPRSIEAEEVERWSEVLFEGSVAYDNRHVWTKGEIEDNILELQGWIEDKVRLMEEYGDEESVREVVKDYEQQIAEWEKLYEDAPQTWEPTEAVWEFHQSSYYDNDVSIHQDDQERQSLDKTEALEVRAELDGHQPQIMAYNREEEDFRLHYIFFLYEDEQDVIGDSEFRSQTQDEAVAMSDALMDSLGMSDWGLERVSDRSDTEKSDYLIYYTQEFNGKPMLFPAVENAYQDKSFNWRLDDTNTEIHIMNGRVLTILMRSPLEVKEVENDNIRTLPFSEIYESFKSYADSGLSERIVQRYMDVPYSFQVTRIEEKMFRTNIKGNNEDFRMIPVWVFYGKAKLSGMESDEEDWIVVNAVDGSVIDTNLGY